MTKFEMALASFLELVFVGLATYAVYCKRIDIATLAIIFAGFLRLWRGKRES
jgi:hypothetical protein